MKLECGIIDDLIPLYLEDMCSPESRAAVEEHLKECDACREKAERMRSPENRQDAAGMGESLELTGYAKRVRRHRLRLAAGIAAGALLAAAVLAVLALTLIDMHRAANPAVTDWGDESGVYDLTASALEAAAEEVEGYVFYTNTTRIQVEVAVRGDARGEVMLWDAAADDCFIQTGTVDRESNTVTFTGLTASRRYRVTFDGLAGAEAVVSDGRTVSFMWSLWNVLRGIAGL